MKLGWPSWMRSRKQKSTGRVENSLSPALPYQTVHAVLRVFASQSPANPNSRTRLSNILHIKACTDFQPAVVGTLYNPCAYIAVGSGNGRCQFHDP